MDNHERLRELRDRYLAAQLRGDRRTALRVITDEGSSAGFDAAALSQVIGDAQREIGRLWQEDRISVAEEHVATAISQMALTFVYQSAARHPANGKKVLVACVEGERHDFPARLVADALDLAGFEVRFLGADVPVDSLVAHVVRETPDLVALSVTMTFNLGAARAVVERIRANAPGLPIALGGSACIWSTRAGAELAVDITGSDARELVAAVRELLGVSP